MKPSILIRELKKGAQIIETICRGIDASEARIKPIPDTWAVIEVICHLYDEEREDFREHLDMILHRPEDSWHPIDPEGWVTERHYINQEPNEMLRKFLSERKQSLDWLQSLTAPDWECTHQAPFGTISAGDLLTSWAMHDTLHVRQLIELRYWFVKSKAEPFNTRYAGEW